MPVKKSKIWPLRWFPRHSCAMWQWHIVCRNYWVTTKSSSRTVKATSRGESQEKSWRQVEWNKLRHKEISPPSTGWMPGQECGAGRGRWRSHLRRPFLSQRPAGMLSRLRRGDHLGGWFVRPSIILPRSLVREVKAAVKWMQAPDPWWVVQAKRKREKEDIIAQNPSFDPCFMKV